MVISICGSGTSRQQMSKRCWDFTLVHEYLCWGYCCGCVAGWFSRNIFVIDAPGRHNQELDSGEHEELAMDATLRSPTRLRTSSEWSVVRAQTAAMKKLLTEWYETVLSVWALWACFGPTSAFFTFGTINVGPFVAQNHFKAFKNFWRAQKGLKPLRKIFRSILRLEPFWKNTKDAEILEPLHGTVHLSCTANTPPFFLGAVFLGCTTRTHTAVNPQTQGAEKNALFLKTCAR